jgi:AcrR family transcriptional regulator
MARPKSEDKRNAILGAAARVFAERGLGAATAAISGAAGVAEGTLFTYFRTKDELVNALYREIKMELADAMMSGFPRKKSVRQRFQHIWDCFVNWGVANPVQRRVLALLEVSDTLTEESKRAGLAPFIEIEMMAHDAIEQRILQDLPLEFIARTMQALAATTMEFMTANKKAADRYREMGFEMLWAGIVRKKDQGG